MSSGITNPSIPGSGMRDLAKRLLASEVVAANSSGSNIPAVFRVSEKLRRPLSTLAGSTGFHSLLSRALTLAKRTSPDLRAVQVKPDGSLEGLREIGGDEAAEAAVLLISQLLELLAHFIGESLTLGLVRDVWPDLTFSDTNPGGTRST